MSLIPQSPTVSRPSAYYTRGLTCVSGLDSSEAAAAASREMLRSFVRPSSQTAPMGRASVPTAVSEEAPFPIGPNRAARVLVREISGYRSLREGWDGEGALAPVDEAICDAARFVYAAGRVPGLIPRLETSLNADGTVALDVDDGVGALMFKGDDTIVHAFDGQAPGIVEFCDDTIPPEISRALIG